MSNVVRHIWVSQFAKVPQPSSQPVSRSSVAGSSGNYPSSNTYVTLPGLRQRNSRILGFLLLLAVLFSVLHAPYSLAQTAPTAFQFAPHSRILPGTALAVSQNTPMTVGTPTVDSNGVKSYPVFSIYQGSQQQIVRVLEPTNPAAGQRRRLLYVLPVESGVTNLSSTWSDGLEELRLLDVPNRFNLTLIAPSFNYEPWYGDNVLDPTLWMESFIIKDLVPWGDTFAQGTQRFVIGFSKSGNGTLTLILRNPNVFTAGAAWDAPAQLSDLSAFSGLPINFGTQANFDLYYIPSLVASSAPAFQPQNRLWISGDQAAWTADMIQLHDQLAAAAIPHTWVQGGDRVHSWSSGWLDGAVTTLDAFPALIPPVRMNGQPTGTLPAGIIQTNLSLSTDENATCRYATTAGVDYASMPNTFSSTGGTTHSTLAIGLVDGGSYSYYVRCQDGAGNANPDDFVITFSVASAANSTFSGIEDPLSENGMWDTPGSWTSLKKSDGAYSTNPLSAARLATPLVNADQYAEITYDQDPGSAAWPGVMTRVQGSTNGSGYLAIAYAGEVRLYRSDDTGALNFPLLASTAASVGTAPRRLRLESRGPNHRVYFNGVLALSFTDSTYSTGQPGIAASIFGGPTVKILSFAGGSLPGDTTPPVRTNGQPTGVLSPGTTQTSLSLTTDENATCRYATTAGVAYGSMPNTFSSTGATAHSTLVSGLSDGASFSYYIRCQDVSGNANPDDFVIAFSVASAGAVSSTFPGIEDPLSENGMWDTPGAWASLKKNDGAYSTNLLSAARLATPVVDPDQYAEITYDQDPGTAAWPGVMTRVQGRTNGSGYLAIAYAGEVRLYRSDDAGTLNFPLLASTAASVGTAPRRLRLESQGTTHRVYFNGVLALSFTDSTYSTGQPGIAASIFGGPTVKILSFVGGSLTAPGGSTPTVTFTGAPAGAAYNTSFTVTAATNASTMPTITPAGVCTAGAVTGTAANATATVTMTSGTGTCSLTANWPADANFLAGTATQSTTATLATPTVSFTGAPVSAVSGATFDVTATTNASIAPTINGTTGVCTVTNQSGTSPSTATITMINGTGTCGLTALWAATANYASASATQTTNASLTTPTVTFTGAPASAAYNSSFIVTATTNGRIMPTITPTGVCTAGAVTGTPANATATVTMSSGTGTCALNANWPADATFLAATANQSTTATLATPTVTFTGAPASAINGATFTVTATTNASIAPTINGTTGVCTVTNQSGTSPSTATITMINGTGACGLTAVWAATANYASASATQTTTASQSTPTVTFTGAPASAAYSTSFIVTATTNASIMPTITPTGVCTVGAVTGTPANATATVTMSSGTGTCGLTASWPATATFNAATATQATAAAKISSTTTIASHTPNPSAVGQLVTIKFRVAGTGLAAPSGSVTVTANTGESCSGTITAGACTLTFSTAGSRTLTAVYNGDANYNPSTSAGVTQSVGSVVSITLTSSPNPSYVNQQVVFSVVVSGSAATPTGTITFKQGTKILGTATLADGLAAWSYTFTKAGNFSIVASYSGDQYYRAKDSLALKQTVQKYTTKTVLTTVPDLSTYGQPVTLTAIVGSSGPVPTGSVTFRNGGTLLGSVPLIDGVAKITKSTLPAGTLAITASYNGTAVFATSASPTLTQAVSQATTSTTHTASPNPSVVGQSVTLKATVKSPTVVPTGTVTFTNGTTTLGTVSLVGGKASLITSALPFGANTITATYSGNPNITGSSGSVVQTVK